MTEDLLFARNKLPNEPFQPRSPLGAGWHWPPVHIPTPAAASLLGPSTGLCFSPLSSSSVHCPGSSLLVCSSPVSCLLLPLQPVSPAPSPPVFEPCQEWGQTSTLSKAVQTSSPPTPFMDEERKEEGTLNCKHSRPGWQLGRRLQQWAREMRRRRGGLRTECGGGCSISVLRLRREESQRRLRCSSASDCESGPGFESQLRHRLPCDSGCSDYTTKIPSSYFHPPGTPAFQLYRPRSHLFLLHCVDVILTAIKLFISLTEGGVSLITEKVET